MSETKIFGTDGIRSLANCYPLDPASLVRLGQAIADYFLTTDNRNTVLIGKDTRLSGYMIEYALSAGLTSAGANVLLTGPLPTAGVAYLTSSMRADVGIVVSASHNSYEDNGIKIFASDGYKLPDDAEAEITQRFFSDKDFAAEIKSNAIGKIKRIDDAAGRYIVFLKNFIPRDYRLDKLKIGLDCANGAAYQIAPAVFDELGAHVVTRGVSPSGKNINSGFGSLYPEVVSKLVLEHSLDVGFAFDGDSDRLVAVDEKGEIISGDRLLAILALDMAEAGELKENTLVATEMSNYGLDAYLNAQGIDVLRSKVGDRHVLEMLRSKSLNLGGEESGHIMYPEISTCGDGILTAIKLLKVMLKNQLPLSKLAADFKLLPREFINLEVREKPPLSSIDGYDQLYAVTQQELRDRGRQLIRYSGTENKLRVLIEADSDRFCKDKAEQYKQFFESRLG